MGDKVSVRSGGRLVTSRSMKSADFPASRSQDSLMEQDVSLSLCSREQVLMHEAETQKR